MSTENPFEAPASSSQISSLRDDERCRIVDNELFCRRNIDLSELCCFYGTANTVTNVTFRPIAIPAPGSLWWVFFALSTFSAAGLSTVMPMWACAVAVTVTMIAFTIPVISSGQMSVTLGMCTAGKKAYRRSRILTWLGRALGGCFVFLPLQPLTCGLIAFLAALSLGQSLPVWTFPIFKGLPIGLRSKRLSDDLFCVEGLYPAVLEALKSTSGR